MRTQAFYDYLERHVRLLGLIASGRRETRDAEILEDSMDEPWFRMTEEDAKAFEAVAKLLETNERKE